MIPFGSVMFLLVLLFIAIFAAAALLARRRNPSPREALPIERQLMRGAAVTHAILFTAYWALLLYQHAMPNSWVAPSNVVPFLIWLPLFLAHLLATVWVEARGRFGTADVTRERESYREGYADGRRDAERDLRREPLVRLTGEGELLDDYPDLGQVKRKRGGEHDPAG